MSTMGSQICSTQIFCVPNESWVNSISTAHPFFYYSKSNYLSLLSSYQWAHMSSSSCKSSCRKVNEHIDVREVMNQSVYGHRSLLPLWSAMQHVGGQADEYNLNKWKGSMNEYLKKAKPHPQIRNKITQIGTFLKAKGEYNGKSFQANDQAKATTCLKTGST